MRRFALALACGMASTLLAAAEQARGDEAKSEAMPEDVVGAPPVPTEVKPRKSRWHGSIAHFDQSVSTPTVGLGRDYQSGNASYEWWFALKPRYYLYETHEENVSLNAWANMYLELTNSDVTTRRNELVVGPTWLWAYYSRLLYERGEVKTSVTVGPRLRLPTDTLPAYGQNTAAVTSLGAGAGIAQAFPICGKGASVLPTGRIGFEATYYHPLHRATTQVSSGVSQVRQDVEGRTIVSDQVDGSMNVQHELWLSTSGNLRITDKLGLRLSYVLLNFWDYRPPEVPICTVSTGCVTPSATANPTRYRVIPWVLASIDYDVIDEMSLSLGYYNATSQIGPGGQRRNPFWSPDARIFFTVVGNLDVIYDTLTKGKSQSDAAARADPAWPRASGGF